MIDFVFNYLVSELNDHFNVRSQTPDRAEAGSLFDLDGNLDPQKKNKVLATLVNVAEERTYRSVETVEKRPDGTGEIVRPPLKVCLYVLFVANFADYEEAMKALGQVMGFFHNRPSFHFASIPGLTGSSGRMTFELHSMSFEQINHLWGALGSKYMPSVLYKAGLVDVRDRQVEAERAPVTEIATTAEAGS